MDALLLAVLNALWQGTALIALVAVALRIGLRRNATTACVVWSITFLVVALLPALDLALARPAVSAAAVASVTPRDAARMRTIATASMASAAAASAVRGSATVAFVPNDAIAAVRASVSERVGSGSMQLGGVATTFARAWGFALLVGWACVAGALLLRLARGYAAIVQMKRDAIPLDEPRVLARLHGAGHRRRAAVARSLLVDVPCAVGFRRPMILIPARLAASLDAEDLARVVLHESAHLQRYDDWLNALEQIVCALQFFQPALHLARRGIDFEREVACDDRVLEDAGEPLRYAECLARMVQRSGDGPRVAVAPGFVLRRAQVVGRVHRIVDRSRDASPQLRFAAVALTAVVLAATLGIARLQVPVVATAAAATPAIDRPRASAAATAGSAATAPRATGLSRSAAPSRAIAAKAARAARVRPAPAAPASKAIVITKTTTKTRTTIATVTTRPVSQNTPRADVSATHARCERSDNASAPAPVARPAAIAEPIANAAPVARTADVAAASPANAPRAEPAAPSAPSAAHGGGDLLDAVDEAKYPRPTIDELVALRNQGVTGDYVRRMNALVRPRPALRDIMAFAVQGATPDYVAGLNRRLGAELSADKIVALRVQGVSIAWLDGLAALGYAKLGADDAVALAVQGVSAAYVRGLQDAGLRNLTPSQLVALRVQGVDGTYVRRLAAHGYKSLNPDEIVRLKVTGFEP